MRSDHVSEKVYCHFLGCDANLKMKVIMLF